ncbi:MAG TPA: cysteine desulfurase family protein [Candidatus Saccharimonadales bacterium]|nr:cysteine desulfurase family protein [Candidatus Saccharimonadales bacterium]
MMKNMIYLDYAAATPMDKTVHAAMEPYFWEHFYNPSATYLRAKAVKKDLEAARAKVAHWFGARPSEVIFTAGATEANNLAINGIMQQYPQANIVVSAIEHESVLAPTHQYDCREVPVTPQGLIDVDALKQTINDQTALVSIMYANNEIGTVQPIRHIGQLLEEIRRDRRARGVELPIYLHTDAAQAANYLDIHASRLGADFISINGGKIYGPKQTGALFVSAKVRLQPQILGGGQERGVRSGTENVPGFIGLATALDLVQKDRHQESVRLQRLQKLALDEIAQKIPTAQLNGSKSQRLPNNIHITIPGQDNERLLMALDEADVMCAAGSACSASNEEPSHVLRALGRSDQEAQASLRLTMGRHTTEEDVVAAIRTLADLIVV